MRPGAPCLKGILVTPASPTFGPAMQVLIRIPDAETERKALGKLIPRCSGKSWANGETMVPANGRSFLAGEGIMFTVIGPAPYEGLTSLRDSSAVAV